VPRKGTVFVSVREGDKPRILDAVRQLFSLGFKVMATSGTARFLADNGVPTEKVNKVLEGRPHIVDAITNGDVQLVFQHHGRGGALATALAAGAALLHKVHITPLFRVPWRPRRASALISAGTLRSARCRVTFPNRDNAGCAPASAWR